MDIQRVISILSQYPFIDVEKSDGSPIQKHIKTSDLTAEMVKGWALAYVKITITPKKMMGNSPMRVSHAAIEIDSNSLVDVPQQSYNRGGLNGFNEPSYPNYPPQHYSQYHQPQQPMSGNESGLYKILYETALNDLRAMTTKYEEEREKRHTSELELSGSKNSVIGDIAQGLSGFAPMLMGMAGGGAGVGMGEAPQAQTAQAPQVKPISDAKLAAIVKYYNTLDDEHRQKIYDLLAKVFANMSLIDSFMAH
jgi:hypothetical protein